MRILLAIAHYANECTPEAAAPLIRCLVGWRGMASWGVQDFGGPCWATLAHTLSILVVDDGVHSAMEYVPAALAERVIVHDPALHLPLACRRVLDERRRNHDMLCYSEHDNWPITEGFLDRIAAYAAVNPGNVLIPHRYERIATPPYKVYIDGENGYGPYGAMWAVTSAQWGHWRQVSHFTAYSEAFAGPLESGCAWSLMQTFQCVKPERYGDLESEHAGERYAARAIARGVVWM